MTTLAYSNEARLFLHVDGHLIVCEPGESPHSAYARFRGAEDWAPQDWSEGLATSAIFGFFVEEDDAVRAQLIEPHRARSAEDVADTRSAFEARVTSSTLEWLPPHGQPLYQGVKFGVAHRVIVEPDPPHELAAVTLEDAWLEVVDKTPSAAELGLRAAAEADAEDAWGCGYGILIPTIAHFRIWMLPSTEVVVGVAESELAEWAKARDLAVEWGPPLGA